MQNNLYDVIIIGAGLSGLYAAFTILDKDPLLDILVIEATDRVGGRIESATLKVSGGGTCAFDLGSHWVSSSQRHMMQLVDLLKLTLVPQPNDGLAIGVTNNHIRTYSDHPIIGGIYSRYEIKWFFAMLEEMSSYFKFMTVHNKILADFYDTISMEQFIVEKLRTVAAKKIARNIVLTTCGVEASEISMIFYLLLCNSTFGFTNQYMVCDHGAREYWILEGAEEIIKRLENIIGKGNIVLSEPVVEITQIYTKDLVYVKTASGKKINGSNIICTIPPAQILNISFQPTLSRTLKTIFHNTKKGLLIKFIITYEERFWAKQGYSGEIFCCDEGPIRICHDATRNGHPALMGYIYDSYLDFQGADGLFKEEVIKQLVEYFGEIASEPIDYIEKSWKTEIYSAGSPMYCFGVGFVKWSRYSLLYPCGRIHWAGAETALEWYGYMNGAIQSGYNAAIEVLYDIRPQSINYQDMTNIIRLSYNLRTRLQNSNPINKFTIVCSLVGGYMLYKLIKFHILV